MRTHLILLLPLWLCTASCLDRTLLDPFTTQAPAYVVPDAPRGDVTVRVDAAAGTWPISPAIFGLNDAARSAVWGTHPVLGRIGTTRMGGVASADYAHRNRISTYNWETNWSNAGADAYHHNDRSLSVSPEPGAAVREALDPVLGRSPGLGVALVPVSLLGFVSAPWPACNQSVDFSSGAESCNAPLPAAADADHAAVPAIGSAGRPSFLRQAFNRPGDDAHALATATPDTSDDTVFTDDFLAWLRATYPGGPGEAGPPLIGLDDEPDRWGSAHPEVRGAVDAVGPSPSGAWTFTPVRLGFADLVDRSIAAGLAVKSVLGESAKVLGPSVSGWSAARSLDQPAPPPGYDTFVEYYLTRMKQAHATYGHRLLDVLDVHLFSLATSGGPWEVSNQYAPQGADEITAREQGPRTFWDPLYRERGELGDDDVLPDCGADCSPRLLPRLREIIAAAYPGTGLAVSAYAMYREGDMSGAIAQADLLGILAREQVTYAAAWPTSSRFHNGYSTTSAAHGCLLAAMQAYVDFDGEGTSFGDTFIATSVSDPARPVDWMARDAAQTLERVTAYAAGSVAAPHRMVIVAINKSLAADGSLPPPLRVGFAVKATLRATHVTAYRVSLGTPFNQRGGVMASWPDAAADCRGPAPVPDLPLTGTNTFEADLPSQSITTFVVEG